MKTPHLKSGSRLIWIIIMFSAVVWSCQNENVDQLTTKNKLEQAEESAVASSQFVAMSHDILDLTAGALAGQGADAGGRYTPYGKMRGPDIDCGSTVSGSFNIDKSHPDSVVYSGTLIIDFGDGSSCQDSTEVLSGKITDSFVLVTGSKVSTGYNLTESIAFEGFHKDSVGVDGTFISKSSSRSLLNLTIQHVKITYPDSTFATWDGSLTNTYDRGENEWSKEDDSKEITGSLTGTTRSGVSFSGIITKAILFKYSCSKKIPVSGTIDLTAGGVDSILDYGSGTCDKTYTISTNGNTTELKFHDVGYHHGD